MLRRFRKAVPDSVRTCGKVRTRLGGVLLSILLDVLRVWLLHSEACGASPLRWLYTAATLEGWLGPFNGLLTRLLIVHPGSPLFWGPSPLSSNIHSDGGQEDVRRRGRYHG